MGCGVWRGFSILAFSCRRLDFFGGVFVCFFLERTGGNVRNSFLSGIPGKRYLEPWRFSVAIYLLAHIMLCSSLLIFSFSLFWFWAYFDIKRFSPFFFLLFLSEGVLGKGYVEGHMKGREGDKVDLIPNLRWAHDNVGRLTRSQERAGTPRSSAARTSAGIANTLPGLKRARSPSTEKSKEKAEKMKWRLYPRENNRGSNRYEGWPLPIIITATIIDATMK